MWPLTLSLLLHNAVIRPFPIFTFNGTSDPSATPSFASLVSDVDLPDIFILCCSSKQARFDNVGFFSVAGNDSGVWLAIKLDTLVEVIKLKIEWNRKSHNLRELQNPKLDYWYHVCMRMDLFKKEIEIAVNGVLMGRVSDDNITNIPNKLKMKIGTDHKSRQFQGSVANLQIFTFYLFVA